MTSQPTSSAMPSSRRLPSWGLRLSLLLLVMLIASLLFWQGLRWVNDNTVTVVVEGQRHEIHTQARTVEDVLSDDMGMVIDDADIVSPALDEPIQDGMVITLDKADQLVLDVDGAWRRVYTHARTPLAILAEQNISLNTGDRVWVNHQLAADSTLLAGDEVPNHLRVVRAKGVTIFDDDTPLAYRTTATTVGQVLDEQDLSLYLADHISPSLDTPIVDGMAITITRSQPVVIEVDGTALATRAVGSTVGEVINRVGFQLVGLDYTIPAELSIFTDNMTIQVIRVIETIETEQSVIPYKTIAVIDPSLAPTASRVVQVGQAGIMEQQLRIRRENNAITSQVVQHQWIVRQPVPQIIAYGRR